MTPGVTANDIQGYETRPVLWIAEIHGLQDILQPAVANACQLLVGGALFEELFQR